MKISNVFKSVNYFFFSAAFFFEKMQLKTTTDEETPFNNGYGTF